MGIFDDAIREHLELRRRQGADDDELARLEDEAFGPPARPGDPDFPESDEVATAGGEVVDVPTAGEPIESPAAAQGIVSELPAVEEEHVPAPEPPLPESPFDEAAPAAEAEPAAESEDLELDLELDLQEELEEVGELGADMAEADEPLAGDVETPAEPDVPIETLPTVEHHFADALDEAEVVEDPPPAPPLEGEPPPAAPAEDEPPPAPPAPGGEGPASAAAAEPGQQEPESADDAEEGEDVLEETPEFLRDQPEDDELWFEQGEPKDFDF